jgi:hypothetical protein
VVFGFPFEAITSASVRADVMQRIIAYLEETIGPLPYDWDRDGHLTLYPDYASFAFCMLGPDAPYAPGNQCLVHDADEDLDVDFADFAGLQDLFPDYP